MDERCYDFFISYASEDRDVARGIAVELKNRGLRTWFDEWNIRSGSKLVDAIESGMQSSRTALILLSDAALDSAWVSREWEAALRNSWSRPDFRVIPVLLGEHAQAPSFLREWRALRVKGDHESETARELLDWISSVGPGRTPDQAIDDDTARRFKELAAAIAAIAEQEAADR